VGCRANVDAVGALVVTLKSAHCLLLVPIRTSSTTSIVLRASSSIWVALPHFSLGSAVAPGDYWSSILSVARRSGMRSFSANLEPESALRPRPRLAPIAQRCPAERSS